MCLHEYLGFEHAARRVIRSHLLRACVILIGGNAGCEPIFN
jgi:hypothetical protein